MNPYFCVTALIKHAVTTSSWVLLFLPTKLNKTFEGKVQRWSRLELFLHFLLYLAYIDIPFLSQIITCDDVKIIRHVMWVRSKRWSELFIQFLLYLAYIGINFIFNAISTCENTIMQMMWIRSIC